MVRIGWFRRLTAFLGVTFLLAAGPVPADPVLDDLASASTPGEHKAAIDAFRERLEAGSVSPELADAFAAELASTLAGDWDLYWTHVAVIVEVVALIDRPPTDSALNSLNAALGHPAMLNRSGALDILATVPAHDDRHAWAVEAVASVLGHEHQSTRMKSAQALARLGAESALPDTVLAQLIETAMTDMYVTVRINAASALSYQDLDDATTLAVTQELVREVLSPTEVTNRARRLSTYDRAGVELRELLLRFYEPPLPSHVVDVFIAHIGHPYNVGVLDVLRQAAIRGEISAEQRSEMRRVADTVNFLSGRLEIYSAMYAGQSKTDLEAAVKSLESGDDPDAWTDAAWRVLVSYQDNGVPPDVADIAATRLTNGVEPVLPAFALVTSAADSSDRAEYLVWFISKNAENRYLPGVASLISLESLERLLASTAADERVPVAFRAALIRGFERRAGENPVLKPEVQEVLRKAARRPGEYQASQAASDALEAWGEKPPLRARIANRENQTSVLVLVFFGLTAINMLAGIVSLVGIAASQRSLIGQMVGWVMFSGLMLVLCAAAFVGFIGHNSGPPPAHSLVFNLPYYVGSFFYVMFAWSRVRRARTPADPIGGGNQSTPAPQVVAAVSPDA